MAGAFYVIDECTPTKQVPFLGIHGLADSVVPYTGNAVFGPIPEVMAEFAERAGCAAAPTLDGVITTWTGCVAPVLHVALPGRSNPDAIEFLHRRTGTGATGKEAIRSLKRRLSDVVYRAVLADISQDTLASIASTTSRGLVSVGT